MKAIYGLSLLLALSACEEQKQEVRAAEYRQQAAVDSACSQLTAAVEGFHLKASTAHNDWMQVETIKDELKRGEQEAAEAAKTETGTIAEVRSKQREKKTADLNKELEEANTAKADAEKAYSEKIQQIETALKSGRALLEADAKPQSLKKLEAEFKSTERLYGEVVKWKQRADDAANKYMETKDPDARMDAQRAYSKVAKEHWNLK